MKIKKIILFGFLGIFYQGLVLANNKIDCNNANEIKTKNIFAYCEIELKRAKLDLEKCNTSHSVTKTEEMNTTSTDGNTHKTITNSTSVPNDKCNDERDRVGSFDSFESSIKNYIEKGLTDEADAISKNKLCEAYKESMKKKAPINDMSNADKDGDNNSQIKRCNLISGYNMRNLYKNAKPNFDWTPHIEASEECLKESDQCATPTTKKGACDKLKQEAALCDGAAYLISAFERDWLNGDHVNTPNVKGGNPSISCTGQGISTLDYEGCVKFVNDGAIIEAAQQAIHTGQNLYYQDQAMTAQMEAQKSPETATAGLQALKTGVKGQEDIMNQRAALDTGKFAALASFYAEMPSQSDLKDKCNNYSKSHNDGFPDSTGCNSAATQQHRFGFLMNQQAKEKMKAKLASVGINVASQLVMAQLLAKRARDIDGAIAQVTSFKPIDPVDPQLNNAQATFCQLNPTEQQCLPGGLNRTFNPMEGNVINFGPGGTGTAFANNPNATPGGSPAVNGPNAPKKDVVASIGSVITDAPQQGGLADHASAATVKPGTIPGGGGGGGGGGSSGGGGGGGGSPSGQPTGGASSAIAGKAPSYGGGGGSLSMMGGYGINKGKSHAKDDSNPFGKLFGKDGNKSGTVDYGRNPASQKIGNKNDNIFEMISKRYTIVNEQKKLIEYEMAK